MNSTLTQESRIQYSQSLLANQAGNELKPLLKWAGGKRWLVPILKPLWMKYSYSRLVEPFCGGLAIALGLLPEKALLNCRIKVLELERYDPE